MKVTVTKGTLVPSGLSVDPLDQSASVIVAKDQPLATGGQGSILEVISVDGRPRPDLLVKQFHRGLPASLIGIVGALRANSQQVRNASALKALPLLLLKGSGSNGPFEGYLMKRVRGRSLEKLADPQDPENIRAGGLQEYLRFLTLDPKAKLQLALQFVHGMEVFYHAGIIHCDLKPDNVLLDSSGPDLSIIDFDGGVFAPMTSVPAAFSEDRWTDPLYFREKKATGRTTVLANVDSERWATACAVCHILSGKEPYWFISGEADIPRYQRNHAWPDCQGLVDFPLPPHQVAFAAHFSAAFTHAPRTLDYLKRTFHEGYYNKSLRPSPTQLRIQLEQDLLGGRHTPAVNPVSTMNLAASAIRVAAGTAVDISWNSSNYSQLTLNGRPIPPAGQQSQQLYHSAGFTLEGKSALGQIDRRTLLIDVLPASPPPPGFAFGSQQPTPAAATGQLRPWMIAVPLVLLLVFGLWFYQNGSDRPPPSAPPTKLSPPTAQLFVDHKSIELGQQVSLRWSVTDASSIVLEPSIGPQIPSGSLTLSPIVSTVYQLRATGPGGTTTRQQAVTVLPAPPPVEADPPPVEAVSPNPPGRQQPGRPATIGSATAPPVIASLDTVPKAIEQCEIALIRWTVLGASQVRIEPRIGTVAHAGYTVVTPAATTTYTLTALGPGGTSSQEVTLRILHPVRATCSH